jgi:hypothetical protein
MCNREQFEKLMKNQEIFIKTHIDNHKEFRHIPGLAEAMIDFTKNFAFAYKTGFCNACHGCEEWDQPHFNYELLEEKKEGLNNGQDR